MREERKVKTRTLENHEGAAPKFILARRGCATRPDVPDFGFHVDHTKYSNDKEHPKQQLQPDWYVSSER